MTMRVRVEVTPMKYGDLMPGQLFLIGGNDRTKEDTEHVMQRLLERDHMNVHIRGNGPVDRDYDEVRVQALAVRVDAHAVTDGGDVFGEGF